MNKLKKILLIDDDKVHNFLNLVKLEALQIAEDVVVLTNGELGLKYLLDNCQSPDSCPELVIFAHHMPIMDGMEMMLRLQQAGLLEQSKVVFILLAIDSQKEDIIKFSALGVQQYTNKALSEEIILEVYEKYFAEESVNKQQHQKVVDY